MSEHFGVWGPFTTLSGDPRRSCEVSDSDPVRIDVSFDSAHRERDVSRRRIALCGTVLCVLAIACGTNFVEDKRGSDPFSRLQSAPFMQYGGMVERTLRAVPAIHDRNWRLPIFC